MFGVSKLESVPGSLESNPNIIAGWRGLAEAGERKRVACYGAFQTDPIDGL